MENSPRPVGPRGAPDFPLGMGNDFAEDFAEIGVKKGTLLVLWEMKQERR